jgi:hypothetical protein
MTTSLTQEIGSESDDILLLDTDFDNADPFNSEKSAAEKLLEHSSNDIKVLYTLAIGLVDENGRPIFDEELFTGSGKPRFKPTEKILQNEVIRRAIIDSCDGKHLNKKMPQPAKWSKASCTEFLLKYPISNPLDVDFIKNAVGELTILGTTSNAKKKADKNKEGLPWVGDIPILRFILVLVDEAVKPKYKKRFDALTQQELDAGKHKALQNQFLQAAADLWNDPTFNPVTCPYPTLHKRFKEEINLCWELVSKMKKATPERLQKCWLICD